MGAFLGILSPNDATHRSNRKRTVLGLNHAMLAIQREYRPRGSSWALEEGKKTVPYRTGKKWWIQDFKTEGRIRGCDRQTPSELQGWAGE